MNEKIKSNDGKSIGALEKRMKCEIDKERLSMK